MITQSQNHPRKGSQLIIEPLRTLEEVERVKTLLADHPRNYALFCLGINACLRACDLLRLQAKDINWSKKELRVKEKKNKNHAHIALNPEIMNALYSIRPDDPEGLLFPSEKTGKAMTVSTLNQLLKEWTRKAKVKTTYSFGSHTLKKSFIYLRWKFHSVPIEVLSKMAGHKDVRTTYHYIGIIPEQEREIYLKAL